MPCFYGLKEKNQQQEEGSILYLMHHYYIITLSTEIQKRAIRANRDGIEMENRRGGTGEKGVTETGNCEGVFALRSLLILFWTLSTYN